MADRNENGIVDQDDSENDNNFEQELLEPNFDVNIPFPRNRMPNAHPEPVGRYYLGEWSRAEREYRSNSRNLPYRPPVPPHPAEEEGPRVEPENQAAAGRSQENAAQDVAGAARPASPAPPVVLVADEMLDEDLINREYEEDLGLAMDDVDMLNMNGEGRPRRFLYDLQPLANDRNFTYPCHPPDINDSYSP